MTVKKMGGRNGEKMNGKNVRIKIQFNIWWVEWLKNKIGQGVIFHAIIPARYTFQ